MQTESHKAPRIKLKPDLQKILASIYFIINEAETKNWPVTQYDIVKTIFLADKAHLNNYGRPITFDNYVAMIYGPVPSQTYDILKGTSRFKLEDIGIKKTTGPEKKVFFTLSKSNKIKVDLRILSKSDTDILENSLATVKTLGFGQIKRLTHEDPAYEEAWKAEEKPSSYPMSYGMLFESPDFEAAENVKYFSENR